MRPAPRVLQRRSENTRRKSTRRLTPPAMAGWISRGLFSTSGHWRGSAGRSMTRFQASRAILLRHLICYDPAVADFRWPDPVPFNWALDWFDAELARHAESKDRPALWIVDGERDTKLSLQALSLRSNQVANFLQTQ